MYCKLAETTLIYRLHVFPPPCCLTFFSFCIHLLIKSAAILVHFSRLCMFSDIVSVKQSPPPDGGAKDW